MIASNALGFQLPSDFNVSAFDGVHQLSKVIADPNDSADPAKRNVWLGYSTAWTGVAVRLRATFDYNEHFVQSISRSTAPPHEERYFQERALYGCLSSALSALECTYMATYCLCSALAPAVFPLSSAKHLNQSPVVVARILRRWASSDPFSEKLESVAVSSEFQELSDFRNTLAHRGVLPRHHRLSNAVVLPSTLPSNPKALAEELMYDHEMGPDTTQRHTLWTSRTCSDIVGDLYTFLQARVPNNA